MQKPKLTGGLIVFIVWAAITGVNGFRSLGSVEDQGKWAMTDHPSLQGAVLIFQSVSGAGLLALMFTVWLVYHREPGTLKRAQTSLLISGLLRFIGIWTIVLFGGLPAQMLQRMMPQIGFASGVILFFTGGWYYYFLRSKKVREIYAG